MTRRTFSKSTLATAALAGVGTKAQAAQYDVVVVGAGAAGLSATNRLIKAGLSVVCLEAANRIGGRTLTDTSTFGIPFDRGAHWLHNKQVNPFVKIGKKLGLSVYKAPDRYPVYHQGVISSKAENAFYKEYQRISKAVEKAARAGKDISVEEAVVGRNDWSLTAFAQFGSLPMARDIDQISVADWYSAEDGTDWFCKQGYGTLLANHWKDVPVTRNIKVKSIDASGDAVTVNTSNGTIRAKSAVVTTSLGVLSSGDIHFSPQLDSRLRSALQGITMGSYNHIVLQFEKGALDVKPDSWISYHIAEEANGSPKGGGILGNISGTNLYSLEVGGRFGAGLERLGERAMIEFAVEEFTALFGSDATKAIKGKTATRWGADPFVQGSYSGAMPGKAHLRADLRLPIAERIFLAGEATSPTEQATVSGAHKEGLRAADEVINLLAD